MRDWPAGQALHDERAQRHLATVERDGRERERGECRSLRQLGASQRDRCTERAAGLLVILMSEQRLMKADDKLMYFQL